MAEIPSHVETAVRAVADMHIQHHPGVPRATRLINEVASLIGRPRFMVSVFLICAVWISVNLALPGLGRAAFDPAPFSVLTNIASVAGLFVAILVLISQRSEAELWNHREQLILQFTVLTEHKIAKLISLVEELRTDTPDVSTRDDSLASEMSKASDPVAILAAIRESHDNFTNNEQSKAP